MKEGYRFLGEYIRQVDIRNKEGKKENLLGVSVQKQFIQSIANTVGTDFTKYKVVKKGQFTYIPDTSRRGDKIAIALLEDYEEGLVSNVYTVFEVIDTEKLLPEYLMLWFSRPEFDRYARFKSHGSVREVMDWEEMCKVELPVPDIEKQRKIVKAYKTITDRIALKQKINDNLEETAQSLFQEQFAAFYNENELPDGYSIATLDSLCSIKGGKRLPADGELLDTPTAHPYIRVRDLGSNRYVCLTNQFQYIDEETHSAISRYIVNTKGDAPDIEQMNARVRKMLEGAIQSDGIEELFETGKHISVDIFSDEYMDKINAIQLPNTKIKILQRLLSQAIDEFKKVNKIMGVEFADRLKKVVDEYNNRRRDEAYANEVLDDVAEQLAQLLSELKTEKNSFKNMGIDYEEKAFYDILKAVSKKFEFEYPDDKMIELSKRIKLIVDDKSRYTDWSARDDIIHCRTPGMKNADIPYISSQVLCIF